MPELQPVIVKLDVLCEPGETVHAEPVGSEFHIIATIGKIRRLIGKVIPFRARPFHDADLAAELAAAQPPKQKGR